MTSSQEEYLKTIYMLKNTRNKIRVTDIAAKLDVSKPSVNKAIKSLDESGYISYEVYGGIELTKNGENEAIKIIRKRDILKLFLEEVLEVKEELAEQEANAMKHTISLKTQEKLEKYISKVLNLGELNCKYDKTNEKCKNCVKRSIKNKIDKQKERGEI